MITLVGITGRMGAGKSTAAEGLSSTHTLAPMAAPIKRTARAMGWDGEKDAKGRKLLQILGTECGRECLGEDCWLELWKEDHALSLANSRPLVIDDIRFDNEAAFIRDLGVIVIKIDRPDTKPDDRPWWEKLRPHASERGIDKALVDFTVLNHYGVETLRKNFRDLVMSDSRDTRERFWKEGDRV